MKYSNITLKKYQIIKHIINKYAESHDNVTPNINYDKDSRVLEICGISRPISFSTESIGIIPAGAYEVVGQVIKSKTADGFVDNNGMNVYDSAQRVFNIANTNRQEVFDFITANSKSSYCSCCGTNRDRNRLFYIRRVDTSEQMYQVGSSCITEYFDTSYFDLMKEISSVVEQEGRISKSHFSDYNLVDYLALYCMFNKTSGSIKECNKAVIEILDSCEDVSETKWAGEFLLQKTENFEKILTIARFYAEYPNYILEDNMFAIKTVQSMAEMFEGNINIDPYYSKTNCSNVAKMYVSLLADYASDYRRYTKDLFKYNAYLTETNLTNFWEVHNYTSAKLHFELVNHIFNITVVNAISSKVKGIKITVSLNNDGTMSDEDKAKSDLLELALSVNESDVSKLKKNRILEELNKYREECLSRYSNFKPTIVIKHDESNVGVYDYGNAPLVIKFSEDIEQAKSKLSTFINASYSRQKLNNAYKDFSKKYLGKLTMAYTQSWKMNLQFSCYYAETEFTSNWPKGTTLTNVSSYVDKTNKNIVVQYNNALSSLKLPVNSIGMICGADNDISIRIQTFIAKELGLEMPKVRKERTPKTDEDIVRTRPKKNVSRVFNAAGSSIKSLASLRKVNLLNDLSSKTLGVTIPNIGKILFDIEKGDVVYKKDMYAGRIVLDGHIISEQRKFDKKTLLNAVHALEYLTFLSDDTGNLLGTREVTTTKTGTNHTYKYEVTLGKCVGNLQFRISHIGDTCVLKYAPKFVVEKTLDGDKVGCIINLNFSEDCWKDIQQGILKLTDLQRGASVLHGQKNQNLISGSMWMNNDEPQKLTNVVFTQLTGITI